MALVVRAGNEFICLNVFVCLLKQKQTDINHLRGTNREQARVSDREKERERERERENHTN